MTWAREISRRTPTANAPVAAAARRPTQQKRGAGRAGQGREEQQGKRIRTAMSGLSASTYSCGGDGDRLRDGGGGGAAAGDWLASLGKKRRMPAAFFFAAGAVGGGASLATSKSSSEGAGDSDESDERSDESSAVAAMLSNWAVLGTRADGGVEGLKTRENTRKVGAKTRIRAAGAGGGRGRCKMGWERPLEVGGLQLREGETTESAARRGRGRGARAVRARHRHGQPAHALATNYCLHYLLRVLLLPCYCYGFASPPANQRALNSMTGLRGDRPESTCVCPLSAGPIDSIHRCSPGAQTHIICSGCRSFARMPPHLPPARAGARVGRGQRPARAPGLPCQPALGSYS